MKSAKEMVETFQCPGCVNGENTRCGMFKLHEIAQDQSVQTGETLIGGFRCRNHEAPHFPKFGGCVNLGLPIPFARVQYREGTSEVKTNVRLHLYPVNYGTYWDVFNVPVWAMEKSDVLFIRTYCPRTDQTYVDVIHGGSMEFLQRSYPTVIDVGPLSERMKL